MPTVTDNCDAQVDVVATSITTPGSCPENKTITRTFTSVDDCGNIATATQVITVKDSKAPIYTYVPGDVTIMCNQSNPTDMATVSDNCDSQVDITVTTTVMTGNCITGQSFKRIFIATDNCGNTASALQNITVQDTLAPTFVSVPVNVTIECDAAVPNIDPIATDNCDGTIIITKVDVVTPGNCPQSKTITRTYIATDGCGNSVTAVQIITIYDTKPPVLVNPPADTAVSIGNVPLPPVVIAIDNCDTLATVTYHQTQTAPNNCGYIIKRTWVASDDCGNTSWHTQTITVGGTPITVNVTNIVQPKCFGDLVGSATIAITNGTAPFNILWDNGQTTLTATNLSIGTHTVTVTDAAGCSGTATVTIIAPTKLEVALSVTDQPNCTDKTGKVEAAVTGGKEPYAFNWTGGGKGDTLLTATFGTYTVTVTDANGCTAVASVVFNPGCFDLALIKTSTSATAAPGETITFNMTVINQSTADAYNINLVDYLPAGMQLNDPDWTLTAGKLYLNTPIAFLAGGASITVPLTVTVSLNATGKLKNTAEIKSADNDENPNNTPPTDVDSTPDDNPTNDVFGGDDVVNNMDGDEDDQDIHVIMIMVPPVFDLALIKTATVTTAKPGDAIQFKVTVFNQGNVNAYNVQVVDYLPAGMLLNDPNWTSIGGNKVQLLNDIDSVVVGANVQVNLNVTIDPNFTGTSLTNISEISKADNDKNPNNTPPTDVDSTPDENPDNDIYGGNDIIDNTNNDEDDHDKEVINFTPCNLKVVAQIDNPLCGGTGSIDVTVLNGSGNYQYDWLDIPGASNVEDRTNLAGGTYHITVTDLVTGCKATADYVIKIGIDTIPPIFTVPANVTVACDSVPAPPADQDLNAHDDCGILSIVYTQKIIFGKCLNTYTIIRTWVVTDNSGNKTTKVQTISVIDNKGPVITYTNPILAGLQNGDTLTVECNNAPSLGIKDVTVTDNCDANPSISFVDLLVQNGDCKTDGFLLLMTCAWVAEDACGNVTQKIIYVKVVDTQAPVIHNVPADVTINVVNGDTIPNAPSNITAKDNCDPNPVLTFVSDTTYNGCDYVIEYKWTAVDHCNNQTIQTYKVSVINGFDVTAAITDLTCDSLGKINLTVSGGVAPFKFDWADLAGTNNPEDRTGLAAGNYTVTVTDGSGCTKVLVSTLADSCDCILPVITSIDVTDADCGKTNGKVVINLAGNLADYVFTWDPNVGNTNSLDSLAPGSYSVIISYKNSPNCFKKLTIHVKAGDSLDVNVISTTNATCLGNDGKATLTQNAAYTYKWSDGKSGNPRNDLAAGTYQVTVSTAAGCSEILTVVIGQNVLTATALITHDTCTAKGSIVLTVNSTNTVTYDWADLPGSNNPKDRTGLSAGTYTVTISDGKGCTVVLSNLIVKDLCKPCGSTLAADIVAVDCGELAPFCLNVPIADIANYSVYDNGTLYANGFVACAGSATTQIKVDTGFHKLLVINLTSNCIDTILLSVVCQGCPVIYSGSLTLSNPDCTKKTTLCLDIPMMDVTQYTFTDNNFVTNAVAGCNNDTLMSYTYSSLIATTPTGPYVLNNWTINGVVYTTTFNNIAGLVAYMNSVDNNAWTVNTTNQTIVGGKSSNVYGKMYISKNNVQVASLEINTQIIPANVGLLLNTGVHFIHVENSVTGCEYDLKISVQCDSASINLIAVDDNYVAHLQTAMMMNVIINDIIPIALEAFQIIEYPKHGHLVMHANNMVEYIQDDSECDITDSFKYLVSNGYTSDIATVTIKIDCEGLVVYTGLSPNNDGLNDKLIIKGIESYPNNEIEVFNRWGNKVYSKKGYTNNDPWDATWDGKMLPDGTYFYFIKDGEGKEYNGYLQIQR